MPHPLEIAVVPTHDVKARRPAPSRQPHVDPDTFRERWDILAEFLGEGQEIADGNRCSLDKSIYIS